MFVDNDVDESDDTCLKLDFALGVLLKHVGAETALDLNPYAAIDLHIKICKQKDLDEIRYIISNNWSLS